MHPLKGVALIAAGILTALSTLVSPASAGSGRQVVHPGDLIQAAVDAASPGDTVVVKEGTYRESVRIEKDGLTLRAQGRVTLEPPDYGSGECYIPGHIAGFCVIPADFEPSSGSYTNRVRDVTITGFRIVGFDDGVFGFGTENLRASDVVAINNSDYGLASFEGKGTTFTRNSTSGSHDAGIYVGDSPDADAVVRHNRSWNNSLGILIRNSDHAIVFHNEIWGNCLGVFLLADQRPGGSGYVEVRNNTVSGNNRLCPAFEDFLPDLGGGGIVLAGSQHNTIFHNLVTDNRGSTGFSGGIVLVITPLANTAGTSDVSRDNRVVLNRLHGNEPADIVVDAESTPNDIVRNRCSTSIPDGLCVPVGTLR
jgi:hypothetical protein